MCVLEGEIACQIKADNKSNTTVPSVTTNANSLFLLITPFQFLLHLPSIDLF